MPLLAFDLLDSIELLAICSRNFVVRCIAEISADADRAASFVEQSSAMATLLAPVLGHERATAIAREAMERGKTVREVAIERTDLGAARINELLKPIV